MSDRYTCIMLDGYHAGKVVTINEIRSTFEFTVPARSIRGIDDGQMPDRIEVQRQRYKLAFFSADSERSHLLYTTDGSPDHFFRGDWIVNTDAYGARQHQVHFISGITVHQKREVQEWVAKLRSFVEKGYNPVMMKEGGLFHLEEIERLLNMPVGNPSAPGLE